MKKAANKGDPGAEFLFGHLLQQWYGVPVDVVESTKLIKKSAMQQDTYAQTTLGASIFSAKAWTRTPLLDWAAGKRG